jgi:hypothetical protein
MFVVGTVQRIADKTDSSKYALSWPVVFEDETVGFIGGTVAQCASREAADALATALNTVLDNPPKA